MVVFSGSSSLQRILYVDTFIWFICVTKREFNTECTTWINIWWNSNVKHWQFDDFSDVGWQANKLVSVLSADVVSAWHIISQKNETTSWLSDKPQLIICQIGYATSCHSSSIINIIPLLELMYKFTVCNKTFDDILLEKGSGVVSLMAWAMLPVRLYIYYKIQFHSNVYLVNHKTFYCCLKILKLIWL